MAFPRQNTITKVAAGNITAAVTTYAAINDRRWRLRKVLASYAGATGAGSVTITGVSEGDDTPVVVVHEFVGRLDLDFSEAGLQCQPGTALVVTLAAGAGVSNLTTVAFPE